METVGIVLLSLLGLLLLWLALKIWRMSRLVTTEMETRVSIKDLPCYQDHALLDKARRLQVAQTYKDVLYQPREGWCGQASMNNVIKSLPLSLPVTEWTRYPRPYPLQGLATLLESYLLQHKVKASVSLVQNVSLPQFREAIREANNPKVRIISNFLRLPLFFCDLPTGGKLKKIFGGHFSPVGGYLAEEDLVYVVDVNAKFDGWLVPLERFYYACNTVDLFEGLHRGLIRVELE